MIPDAIRDNSKMHRCHDNDESNYVDEFILMLFWIDDDDVDDDKDDDDFFTRSSYAGHLAVSPIVTHFW